MEQSVLTRALVIIAVAVFLFAAIGLADYGTSQRACVLCHKSYALATKQTAHSSVQCTACHSPTGLDRFALAWNEWWRMIPAQLVGGRISGPVTEIPRATCLRCHLAVMANKPQQGTALRIEHAKCAPDASCDACHSEVGHGALTRWKREPVMDTCTGCHSQQGATLACDGCHTGHGTTERLAEGPWQVSHGPNWQQMHGLGNLDSCSTCHEDKFCVACHKTPIPHTIYFGEVHGEQSLADRASCEVCHKSSVFCDSCHGLEMPHPAGFLQAHAAVARTVKNPLCLRCHSEPDCVRCHVRHVHPGNAQASAAKVGTPSAGEAQ